MSISGSFSSMNPSDLLQMLMWGAKSGMLTCIGPDDRQHLFLKDGNVVGVTSSRYTDRLGAVLVRLGYISDVQFEEVFLAQASDNRQLGEIVVDKELLSAESLKHALVVQAEDIIYDVLSWNDGEFSFEERELEDREVKVEPIVISTLLLEGARRIDEINRCKQKFNDPEQVFKLNDEKLGEVKLSNRSDRAVVSLLKTSRTLHDIMQIANESEYNVFRSVYNLFEKDIIEIDFEETNHRKLANAKIEYLMELAGSMEKKGWFHEALSNIAESAFANSNNPRIIQMKDRLESKVYEIARRVFGSSEVVPKIRQSVADVSIDKLSLNQREGLVFFRIDGVTNLKNLRHLTGVPQKELYVILHKFMRMGLIYFDEPFYMACSKSKANPK
jgi:hypothetical protein